jgi:hypothetical protein
MNIAAERQLQLIPRGMPLSRRLLRQPYLVDLASIKWGGRPAANDDRVDVKWCGYVMDGPWDIQDKRPIEEYLASYIYSRTVFEIFRDEIPYRSTEQYAEMIEAVRNHRRGDWRTRGCRDEADVECYFERLLSIYDSIRKHGYKSQSDLGSRRWYDEIKVFIDRNGELHKRQGAGHHRLAMAINLQVPKVPVVVIGIHRAWALKAQLEFGKDVISSSDMLIRRDICRTA